ncbi:sugar nucleotide-binding protein, partial [candidate division WOR-3 bacterium]|nr:sugar nucleotide-binding protein [candidate division WOR-3 bacterium]
STDYVFDGQKSSPYIELDSPNPLSVYGKTKLAAERAVSSLVENYAIIRVAWLFGVKGDFVSFVKGEIAQGRSPRLATDHQGSPGYIPDLLAPIYEIARSGVIGIFHLTNNGDCTRFEMGKEIIRILGSRVEPIPSTGAEIGFIASRPRQSVLSCRKYEESFGHTLRSWQEALRAYLKNTG